MASSPADGTGGSALAADGAPAVAAARPENICALAARFGAALRSEGLEVAVGSMITFMSALGAVGVDSRAKVYWCGRATLVHRPEDFDTYDVVFTRFWEGIDPRALLPQPPAAEVTLAFDDLEGDSGDGEEQDDTDTIAVRYSPYELLRDKDFADCTAEELAELAELMSRLRLGGVMRRSRRLQPVRVARGHPDLRRTVRRALQAAGEPISRSFRQPGEQPRRLVLLLDVSGSMESYARALLRFVHAAVVARRRVEAFALGTRLTRLTRELSTRDPDAAFDRAAGAVADWSGGTRLGESIGVFCDLWGVRGMARGAVVVILSDGWDRGEPDAMVQSMARLGRVAHRIVWVNPLKATPGYAPLAQGMAAALPFVDEFVEGHSLATLEELATRVAA